jgi:predicted DNA-binding ribbon-helix-helix protein
MSQGRDKKGHFANKGQEKREVRSLRLTDSAWEKLGKMASDRGITRADLIEEIATDERSAQFIDSQEIIEILEAGLKLKANAGGAIKEKIKEALKLLSPF